MCSFISVFVCKQKTAYERRISDWSADVGSPDLLFGGVEVNPAGVGQRADVDLPSRELPRHDIAVMFERREQHAALFRVRISDEVRSEERRVGNGCVSRLTSRWSPSHSK